MPYIVTSHCIEGNSVSNYICTTETELKICLAEQLHQHFLSTFQLDDDFEFDVKKYADEWTIEDLIDRVMRISEEDSTWLLGVVSIFQVDNIKVCGVYYLDNDEENYIYKEKLTQI